MCYKESHISLITVSIWILFLLSLLDMMTEIIVRRVYDILEVDDKLVILLTSLLTIAFLLIVGRLVKKKNNKGIRTVKLVHILFFTVLTLLDAFMMMALANRG